MAAVYEPAEVTGERCRNLMLSTQDAFMKFRSRLELTDREQRDASRRQKEIRTVIQKAFETDPNDPPFLTGSYIRWTKTKPLKDVDIFCPMGETERDYRDKHPSIFLGATRDVLADAYGRDHVELQRRSVTVDYGIRVADDQTEDEQIMSFDVVPAFATGDHYVIPDTTVPSGWTETNPKVHYDLAVKANEAYGGEWKGLVRMMKKWNREHDKPIKPGFLIEVMALEVLYPPFGGDYRREMQAFFASLAARIHETWPDPAGLGPAVSDIMDAARIAAARKSLVAAEHQAAQAIRFEQVGNQGEALQTWRSLFGPLFPLS